MIKQYPYYLYIVINWILGVSSLAGAVFILQLFSIYFDWPFLFYSFLNFFNTDNNTTVAKLYIIVLVVCFITSYFIYYLLEKLISKVPYFRNHFQRIDYKSLNSIINIILIYLGFLPLFLTILLIDESVHNSITSFFIFSFAGFLFPFTKLQFRDLNLFKGKIKEEAVLKKENFYFTNSACNLGVLEKEINELTTGLKINITPCGIGFLDKNDICLLLAYAKSKKERQKAVTYEVLGPPIFVTLFALIVTVLTAIDNNFDYLVTVLLSLVICLVTFFITFFKADKKHKSLLEKYELLIQFLNLYIELKFNKKPRKTRLRLK